MENIRMLIIISLRKILRNKLNSVVNILGLTLSMTAFLIIILWVRFETNFDKLWPGYDRIYRVALTYNVNGKEAINSAKNYTGVAAVLKNGLPEIEASTSLIKDDVTVYTPDNSIQGVGMFWVDSSVFSVFPRKMQAENLNNLFYNIRGAWISRSLATKLFGNKNPLQQKFKLNEGWEFYVCGIFDDFPKNSHINIELLINLKSLFYYFRNFNNQTGVMEEGNSEVTLPDPYNQSEWQSNASYVYVKLKKGSNIKDVEAKTYQAIKTCIKHLTDDGGEVIFTYQPIKDIHLKSDKEGEISQNGSDFKVKALTLIGIIILIISWFNFVNLSSLQFLKSSVGSGVRMVVGAGRADVFKYHFVETFILNVFAGILSFIIVFILINRGNNFIQFILPVNVLFIVVTLFLLVLIGTLVSSIYPYLVIIRYKPSSLIRRTNLTDQKGMFSRKTLVIFQFAASIVLMIGTYVIFKQISYMQNQKLGINIEQTMVSYSPMNMIKKANIEEKLQVFRNELSMIPGVKGFTTAAKIPGKEFSRYNNNIHLHGKEKNGVPFSITNVDQDFFNLFSVKFIAGNNFRKDTPYGSSDIIINNLASKTLGFTNPQLAIDQIVYINDQTFKIIGVADNYHHQSLKKMIEPVVFFKSLQWINDVGFYCIKISTDNMGTTIQSVKNAWGKTYPNEPYIFSFLDDDFNALYSSEVKFGIMYLFFSILAIFIACMGLFALAMFSTETRIKEIGVRKINGANVIEIIAMLNSDFIKCVAIAFIIACPIAWYAMNRWLQSFAYRTELSWWVFAMAGALALAVAVLTISWQSWRAAKMNPVEALRYE